MTKTDYPHTFDGLMALVTHLRGPDGCPWDREQTARSMRRYVMEECHELVEAMDEGKAKEVAEELGDVVFHVAFQIRIWGDEGEFGESDVFGSVIEKLVRRHPHVFGGEKASGADQVLGTWQSLKAAERDASASIMDGVPSGMPALAYSQALQSRAAGVGFDWEEQAGVAEKVVEEVAELGAAPDADERERELGDMLFSIVNLARWLRVDAESALRGAASKFRRRYELMEAISREQGLDFASLSADDKDALWREAKGSLVAPDPPDRPE